MKNTLFRRAAVGIFATAAAVGLSTLFATAASAHAVVTSGTADCGQDGQYTITWTVQNDYTTPVTVSGITASPSGSHGDIVLAAHGKQTFTTTYAGTTKTDVRLTVYGLWKDGNKTWPTTGPMKFVSDPVHLKGDCKAPTTPPATSTPPTHTPSTPTPVASSPTPGLPVTGSSNTLPMVGTGAALIAGGAVLVVTLRRRRRVTFTAE